jgi:hypothetical protein
MTQYALFFSTETKKPVNLILFKDAEIPPAYVHPDGQILVTFNETTPNFDLLYGLFVEDPDRNYDQYDHFNTEYNADTQEFTFVKRLIISNLELIRTERNTKIKFTDELMHAPDLPSNLRDDLVAYRQALRDITVGLSENVDPMTFEWPELPAPFAQPKPLVI